MSATAILDRHTFETSQLLGFFSEKELVQQIGNDRELWPLVPFKALIDNSPAARETTGAPPEIVRTDTMTVTQEGPRLWGASSLDAYEAWARLHASAIEKIHSEMMAQRGEE